MTDLHSALSGAAEYLLLSPDGPAGEICPFELDEAGVQALAELLHQLAPFVPVIEAGVRLAAAIRPETVGEQVAG